MKKIKSITTLAVFSMLVACAKNKENKMENNTVSEARIVQKNIFEGNFSGSLNGAPCALLLQAKGNDLTGTITINGQLGDIIGTSNAKNCLGNVIDQETSAQYPFTAQLVKNELLFQLDLTAFGGQLTSITFSKETQTNVANVKNNNGNLNSNLFGLWRHTSVYSSGTGDMHFSMQTDYFLELKPNGQFIRWSGDSSGGTQEVSAYTNAEEDKTTGSWYCEGKFLCTKLESPNSKVNQVQYYQENNQMMFTRNGEKTVYERIR